MIVGPRRPIFPKSTNCCGRCSKCIMPADRLDFYLLRQGSRHEVYCLDGLRIPIPCHNEASERTTLDIINESEQKLGKGWWQ